MMPPVSRRHHIIQVRRPRHMLERHLSTTMLATQLTFNIKFISILKHTNTPEDFQMTSIKETDYQHPNERGNGPKERMEGGDLTDDIDINDPETRKKHLEGIKRHENDDEAQQNK